MTYPKKGQKFTISPNKTTGDRSYTSREHTCLKVNDISVVIASSINPETNIVLVKTEHDFDLVEEKKMTPCTKKGWKEREVFECVDDGNETLNNGDVLVLIEDDDSGTPGFQHIKSRRVGYIGYYKLSRMKRIYPPEEESKKVDVVCDLGDYIVITKEDAKELNLI